MKNLTVPQRGDYMDTAAIYCRLSKEDEEKKDFGDESESIQNQKLILIEFAQRNGFALYDIYIDDDYSGLDRDRPSFNTMIKDAKKGCFNTVICKSQSRFTRDMELVEKYIHGLFPVLGIRFIGVVDNIDTSVKGNKKARQINGLINEWYCEDLSENIRSVFKSKMQQGQFLGSFAPYGYGKDPNDKHRLIIDNEAAEVVKKIFGWYIEGLGSQKIRNKLYEERIPTPLEYKKLKTPNFFHPSQKYGFSSKYGLWAQSTIKRILSNEVYIGSIVQGKEKKVSYKSKKMITMPKQEWIIVPNCHQPIIEKEDFLLVQKMLKENKYETKNKTVGEKEIFIFSGKVYCKNCGNKMYRIMGRNTQSYLYCQVFSRSGGKECRHNSIREGELTKIVKEKIQIMIEECFKEPENVDCIKKIINQMSNKAENISKQKIREAEALKEKLDSIKNALAMLYVDKLSGKLTEKEYGFLKESFLNEIDVMGKKTDMLKAEIIEMEVDCKKKENIQPIINKYCNLDKLSNEVLNHFVNFIEIDTNDDKKEVIIHWNV
ncbi:MAG: recombinase family protein [Lachnospiraceae bacterium]|nr:recombinase family protein [Lachnospiraceae bacterium]